VLITTLSLPFVLSLFHFGEKLGMKLPLALDEILQLEPEGDAFHRIKDKDYAIVGYYLWPESSPR
jgi:hypothetical protein